MTARADGLSPRSRPDHAADSQRRHSCNALFGEADSGSRLLAESPGAAARAGALAKRECRRRGQAVRALPFDRLAPHLAGVTDVYLVPDGPLVDLPWQALPDGASRYLVEAGPRFHLLNAERELIESVPPVSSGSLPAVGAPDFESRGSPAAVTVAAFTRSAPDPCAGAAASRFDPLPSSGREHTSDENEGLLTAEEVLTLDLAGTAWVVLSACHSGESERWSHEGSLGMRRAFDLAGARTVIASQ